MHLPMHLPLHLSAKQPVPFMSNMKESRVPCHQVCRENSRKVHGTSYLWAKLARREGKGQWFILYKLDWVAPLIADHSRRKLLESLP